MIWVYFITGLAEFVLGAICYRRYLLNCLYESGTLDNYIDTQSTSFQYCDSSQIIEAYKVGGECVPNWLFKNQNMTIIVSPSFQILCNDGDHCLIGSVGEYCVQKNNGEIEFIPEKVFESRYRKIAE